MKWISVNEGLPEKGYDYLVWSAEYEFMVSYYNALGEWRPKETGCGCCSSWNLDVTHWMPLLIPPESKSNILSEDICWICAKCGNLADLEWVNLINNERTMLCRSCFEKIRIKKD